PFSILFRGCSTLIVYEAGVLAALNELSRSMLESAPKIDGSSSGSLIATFGLCGCDVGKGSALPFILWCLKRSNVWKIWSCKRSSLEPWLSETLPKEPSQRQQVFMALCLPLCFPSHPQVLLCSCFIPFCFGLFPPMYRGVVMDGEIGMWRSSFMSRTTITMSAFTGEFDICPKDCPAAFLNFQLSDCTLQISKRNLSRLLYI
ncbi:PLPL1 protein, partial [Amazona guildingii]|nr:PLPL1 protein [Amazona guildingii]